jgi:hypothetical protein
VDGVIALDFSIGCTIILGTIILGSPFCDARCIIIFIRIILGTIAAGVIIDILGNLFVAGVIIAILGNLVVAGVTIAILGNLFVCEKSLSINILFCHYNMSPHFVMTT